MFDVAVVGLGLIGAAALRHLTTRGAAVIGIGPVEPDDRATHTGPFASHYDSGRVTRRLDQRLEWAILASRSIEQYPVLENDTGIAFHRPVGFLFVLRDPEAIAGQRRVVADLGLPVTMTATDGSQPYRLPVGWPLFTEPAPAGFIDPRAMLAAQLMSAQKRGAHIRRTHATSIRNNGRTLEVVCADGSTVEADNVLVAAGAYTGGLLPEPIAAQVMPEAVILGRVSHGEAARLHDLPSLIYLSDHPYLEDVYVVPPTLYPDGYHYVKLGGSRAGAAPLDTPAQIHGWMAGSAADEQLPVMRDTLLDLLPDTAFDGFAMKPCLITDTVHGLPFVDQVADRLYVAACGNGHAAKSSDALGALAARLVSEGSWSDSALPAAPFRLITGPFEPTSGSRHGS